MTHLLSAFLFVLCLHAPALAHHDAPHQLPTPEAT
jgi:hypothetical protein